MSMLLQCKDTTKPHPEGIHAAVCVDVVDLGLVEVEFQGVRKSVNKVKVVFESEARWEDGKACTVSRNFTASLHPKAKLADFLGKWRGRPVVPGETIDLAKLVGASCTLVISHQQNLVGRTYASIDAVSKPSRKVAASGQYDPAEMRRRIAEWSLRTATAPGGAGAEGQRPDAGGRRAETAAPAAPTGAAAATKSGAAQVAAKEDYDPEVGF